MNNTDSNLTPGCFARSKGDPTVLVQVTGISAYGYDVVFYSGEPPGCKGYYPRGILVACPAPDWPWPKDLALTPFEPRGTVRVERIIQRAIDERAVAIVTYLHDHYGYAAGSKGVYLQHELTKFATHYEPNP